MARFARCLRLTWAAPTSQMPELGTTKLNNIPKVVRHHKLAKLWATVAWKGRGWYLSTVWLGLGAFHPHKL